MFPQDLNYKLIHPCWNESQDPIGTSSHVSYGRSEYVIILFMTMHYME